MWLEFPFDPAYLKALRVGQGQSEQVTEQVTEQVARLLVALGGQTLSLQELMHALGLSHRPNFLALHLRPALAAKLIQMTVPDKPNSRLQKYRLTQAGHGWVASQG
jgi:ATP-dependent DNA helicase RecG